MDNNIEKYQSKELVTREAQIANALETHPKDWQKDIQPGNYIIDMTWHDPRCYRIVSIEPEKDIKLEFEKGERKEIELDTYHLNVKAVGFDPFIDKEYEAGSGGYNPERTEVRALTIDGTDYGRNYLVFKNKEELIAYVNRGMDAINGKDADFLKTDNISDDNTNEESTALVSMSASKQTYLNAQNTTLALKEEMDRKLAIVKLCIAEQREKVEAIQRKYRDAIMVVERKLTRIRRVLGQLELYTGVNEDVIQIQEGTPAPIDEPIQFFQEVLYMDEEVGDWQDGGLDFTKIEQFDEWLLRNNHLDLFVSKKGVRVFRVRRNGKQGGEIKYGHHYVYNPYLINKLDENDIKTYIIVRNGDNVYRIWADLIIHPYLFPKQDELQKLVDELENEGINYIRKSKQERIEDFIDRYKFNFCLLQGLLDRSDVLAPHNPVNLFKEGLESPYVQFVYDAEYKRVSDGHPDYWHFVTEINKDIKVGSRVLFLQNYVMGVQDRFDERYYSWNRDKDDTWGLPNVPETGLYTIEKNSHGDFVIKYMPDKTWHYDPDRKNRISFKVYTDAREVLNYDALDIETVEYYLNNRINRADYLSIMPMLENVHKQLLEEMKQEESFILLLKGQVPNVSDELIKETIKWWKLKNKVKRPITSNDALAYKQILNKLQKFN